MALHLVLDLPADIEAKLRQESVNVEADAREVFAVDLYRRGTLTRWDLGRVLGLDRFEVDALLKRHNVFEGALAMEDLERDSQALENYFGKATDASRS